MNRLPPLANDNLVVRRKRTGLGLVVALTAATLLGLVAAGDIDVGDYGHTDPPAPTTTRSSCAAGLEAMGTAGLRDPHLVAYYHSLGC
jgi:hypothetical protein